jgi:type I restriction enzyme, S subunit
MATEVNLKEIIESPLSGEWGDDVGETKIIRTTNFRNDGKLDLADVVGRLIDDKKIDKKRLMPGDTIIEKSGGSPKQPVGRVVFFDREETYLCNNFTSILRPKTAVYPKYLFWYLYASYQLGKTLKYQNKTTGIINLKLDRYINDTKLTLPSLKVQEQIAQTLNKAQLLRDKDQLLLDKYEELAQSIFFEMFGDPVTNNKRWPQVKLSSVCRQITDGTHFSPPPVINGVPYVTAKHVRNNEIDFYSDPTYVSVERHKEIYARCKPCKGDIVYIKDGATTGMAAINHYDFEFSMLSSLALIKPNEELLNNYYLKYWLNNDQVRNNYLREYMAGAAIRRFTLQKLNQFKINLPPIVLQLTFADRISKLEYLIRTCNKSYLKSSELFKTLLNKFFS